MRVWFGRPSVKDESLSLWLDSVEARDEEYGIDETESYLITRTGSRQVIGYVALRFGESPSLYYLGHIGYRIDEAFRGHGYAGHAVKMLLPYLSSRGLRDLVITTDVDNLPSRVTCERLGCELERIATVPEAYRPVCMMSQAKCRYVLSLSGQDKGD